MIRPVSGGNGGGWGRNQTEEFQFPTTAQIVEVKIELATAYEYEATTEPARGAYVCELKGARHTWVKCNIHELGGNGNSLFDGR
jgi:hypothetical protein